MTKLTLKKIKKLNSERTQGEWELRGTVVCSPKELPCFKSICCATNVFRNNKKCVKTMNFIASAPQIAEQYIELVEKLKELEDRMFKYHSGAATSGAATFYWRSELLEILKDAKN